MNRSIPAQHSDDDAQRPSKTQRKKDSHALQDLGEHLVALPADKLRALALPEDLASAIAEAQRIRAHEGRRRQLQWIGKLMRKLDDTEIDRLREGFDVATRQSREEISQLHALEEWRERLLANDDAITGWIDAHPGTDVQQLRALVRAARKEQAQTRPPRAFRELFQFLKATANGSAPTSPDEEHLDD